MALRREDAVALDEVILAASEAAAAYEDGAHILESEHGDDALAKLFLELATERRAVVGAVSENVERMGDHASAPDPDRETAKTAVRHLKTHLVSSGPLALIRERARGEDRLAARIAEAEKLAPEAQAALARAAASVKHAQRALGDARARLEP